MVTKEAVGRGHAVMHSDPQGPVYLTLPRENLAQEWEEAEVGSFPASRYGAVHAGGVAPEMAAPLCSPTAPESRCG